MVNPSFNIGQQIGAFQAKNMRENEIKGRESQDVNAIEQILAEAQATNDPKVLQNTMGKILSQVSPERQPQAVKMIENMMQNIDAKQKEAQGRQTAEQAGYTYGAPSAVQAQEVKNRDKQQYLQQYGLGGGVPQQQGQMQDQPMGGQAKSEQMQQQPNQMQGMPQQQGQQQQKRFPQDYSDQELISLQGAPYREISEPAKAALQQRQAEAKAAKSAFEPESEKLEAKRVSELATEVEKEYKAAATEELRLDRMVKLDKEGNVSSGALIKVMDTLGLPIGVLSNPSTEEFRKLETDFIRDVSKVFPGGRITNYEIQSYMRTIPSLMNSPEGRKEIIRNRKLMNEAKKVRYEEYKQILKENNGRKPPNLGLLLDERTQDKLLDIEDRFVEGIEKNIEKSQVPLRMYDPQGNALAIPPKDVERALKAGARFQ